MNTNPLANNAEYELSPADQTTHEIQRIIDGMGSDAEWLITQDNYYGAAKLLDRAWDLQRATYDKTPNVSVPRASHIRDALLDIGAKLNLTPTATAMREKVYAQVDAEVLAGTRTLRDAESYKRSAHSNPYSSAARPKDHDYNPGSHHNMDADVGKARTKRANKAMRKARNTVTRLEGHRYVEVGETTVETKYGPCVLRYTRHGDNATGYYELLKADSPVLIDRGNAGNIRIALIESYEEVKDAA